MKNPDPKTKDQILREMKEMKSLEESTCGFYQTIAKSPEIVDEKVKTAFDLIQADERKHAAILQKIIFLVENNL
ncbi:hypothetical protein C4546_02460 [Candidatus Parcubacteria bacterium]|jgi:rubrerythrin|nr:MAG: hypothetical protein C4546_02460 [Candidatus Parcubacteria bacterium]